MITIVEPKQSVDRLWGQQRAGEDKRYRLMRYALRMDHDGRVLLHNVVTGRLVVLDQTEADMLGTLPAAFRPEMEPLITGHFLIPEDYDEHRQVVNLRHILQCLDTAGHCPGITTYTILTTTACNARCYYCFEHGAKTVTMTEETAGDVVRFILSHCGPEKKVFLTWFGGEPTLTPDRIDQICLGLREGGVTFESTLVTNGYLLDRETVAKARDLWCLTQVQICVDGTEEKHNRIKAYVNAVDSPYQRVFRNTAYLLEAGIRVNLRMNFDLGNVEDFLPFMEEVKQRLSPSPLLSVSAHPIIGTFRNQEGEIPHGSEAWFEEKIVQLAEIAEGAGLSHRKPRLPSLNYRECMASRDFAVTITPEGALVRCPEQFGEDQIVGSLREGVTNRQRTEAWKKAADSERCAACVMFPLCHFPANCLTSKLCMLYSERVRQAAAASHWQYSIWKNRQETDGGVTHGIPGTEG